MQGQRRRGGGPKLKRIVKKCKELKVIKKKYINKYTAFGSISTAPFVWLMVYGTEGPVRA